MIGLIKGRHNLPVNKYIFDGDLDPSDIVEIEKIAEEKISIMKNEGFLCLGVYVTGLTVALIAVIKMCLKYDMDIELYHYDRETSQYLIQKLKGGKQ